MRRDRRIGFAVSCIRVITPVVGAIVLRERPVQLRECVCFCRSMFGLMHLRFFLGVNFVLSISTSAPSINVCLPLVVQSDQILNAK